MTKNIEVDFEIGDIVYIRTDEKQLERIITKLIVSPNGITYECSQGVTSMNFFSIEITKEKSELSNRKNIGFK